MQEVSHLHRIFDKAIIISQWRSITVSSTLAESGVILPPRLTANLDK